MPTNTVLLALAAGLISAVVFASATTGPMLLRLVLFVLTPLSIYLAGLGLGPAAAAIAAAMATGIILFLASPVSATVYAVSTALPAVFTTRLALLSRGEGETREWYPVGRIVVAAAAFGALFVILTLTLLGGDVEKLTQLMRELIENFLKSDLATLPSPPSLSPEQIGELAKATLQTLPWVMGVLATGTILFNLWLAGRITLASGRLLRPWPHLAELSLPPSATFTLLAAIALTFLGDFPGLLAGGIAGPFTLAFALVGLALAHAVNRDSPWRNFTLAGLYATLVVFTAGALLMLAIAGLADTIFGFRKADNAPPPGASP